MANENTTLTQTINEPAASSADGGVRVPTIPDGPVSTVEGAFSPEAALNTEGQTDEGAHQDKAEENAQADDAAMQRFDQHPRFRELNAKATKYEAEAREAALRTQRLELELAQLRENVTAGKQQERQATLPYRDITAMKPDELIEWQTEDPVGYAANLYSQVRHELKQEMAAQEQAAKAVDATKKTVTAFADKHPDFEGMRTAGQLRAFMDQNPGHNEISAYLALTEDDRIQTAVAKAIEDANAKSEQNFKAKQNARVLGSGPGINRTPATEYDKALTNTKDHGGFISLAAARLRAMRSRTG